MHHWLLEASSGRHAPLALNYGASSGRDGHIVTLVSQRGAAAILVLTLQHDDAHCLDVKVKGQGHQGQKKAFFGPFGGHLRALYVR